MHKGQVIQKAVKESGISITQLAKKIRKSRQSIYNIFESQNVSIDLILSIGNAIHYDFSKDFKQLKTYSTKTDPMMAEEDNAEYWKQKYIALLEEYNQLLKNKKK
jgi:transcriptional regulator with XRE-family HTH domain